MEDLEVAIHQANILNQDIERNISDKHKFYKEVSEFSEDLANAYARVTDLRLAGIMENSMISTKKSDIIDSIDNIHNFLTTARGLAIENANENILRLAKQYGSENILQYINAKLYSNNRGRFVNENGEYLFNTITESIEGITEQHKRTLDDALEVLNLTSAPNINIIEQIQQNLEDAAAKDYAEIGDIDEIYNNEQEESSTIIQNPSESNENSNMDNTSSVPPKTENEDNLPEIGSFNVDKNNQPLSKPMAQINTDNNGNITFNQIDLNNPTDNDVPIIEGNDGEVEIDLKSLFEINPAHPIFLNDNIVNLDGNSILDDNIEVTFNPLFVIDENNNAKLVNKGQIRKQGEEKTDEEEDASQESSSTGVQDLSQIGFNNTNDIVTDNKEADKLAEVTELQYDPQNLKGDVQRVIMGYMIKNKNYNEDEILENAKKQLNDVSEEDIKEQIKSLRNWAKRRADAKGLDKVVQALDDLTMASDILDEEIKNDGNVNSARELLNNAFKNILDEYAKRLSLIHL